MLDFQRWRELKRSTGPAPFFFSDVKTVAVRKHLFLTHYQVTYPGLLLCSLKLSRSPLNSLACSPGCRLQSTLFHITKLADSTLIFKINGEN